MTEKPKKEYKNIQIPKITIDNATAVMYYFGYRNPHEFVNDCTRRGVERLVKLYFKLEEIKAKNDNTAAKKKA